MNRLTVFSRHSRSFRALVPSSKATMATKMAFWTRRISLPIPRRTTFWWHEMFFNCTTVSWNWSVFGDNQVWSPGVQDHTGREGCHQDFQSHGSWHKGSARKRLPKAEGSLFPKHSKRTTFGYLWIRATVGLCEQLSYQSLSSKTHEGRPSASSSTKFNARMHERSFQLLMAVIDFELSFLVCLTSPFHNPLSQTSCFFIHDIP